MTDCATDLVELALKRWGFDGARYSFIAGRENQVYRVQTSSGDFALRIKRPGYRSEDELRSELLWLDAMDKAGLSVPRPKPDLDGQLLASVNGQFIDMVGWLSGEPLEHDLAPDMFRQLGAEMARLHLACDAWDKPPRFVRCNWNADGLLGASPVWGRFWENPTLDARACDRLKRFREQAKAELKATAKTLDFGLIHADLLHENVLIDGPVLRLLDFDDGGFGFRLFDLATSLLRMIDAPNYTELKDAMIEGYHSRRSLDTQHLDLFLALRAMTYVGWIVPRMTDTGAENRNSRFIKRACKLAEAYLTSA